MRHLIRIIYDIVHLQLFVCSLLYSTWKEYCYY